MPDEIRQFFLEAGRLETALEMETQLQDFKRWLYDYETFWREVKRRLTERLKANDHDRSWVFRFDGRSFGGSDFKLWKGGQIAWKKNPKTRFAVRVARQEVGPENGLCYGVIRGKKIQAEHRVQQDRAIAGRLGELGFTPNEWWSGYRFFHDCGLPRFDLSRVDDVLKLCREMQNDDRPLTDRVVDMIWKLFCDFRQELEDLNRNFPY